MNLTDKDLKRFNSKFIPEPNTGCWLWDGPLTPDGYGTFYFNRKNMPAHRFSFELARGKIPDGKQLDHLCRVRNCINPAHLEPVTSAENTRRGDAGINQSSKTHCDNGHEYTEANIYMTPRGHRNCRACVREKKDREAVARASVTASFQNEIVQVLRSTGEEMSVSQIAAVLGRHPTVIGWHLSRTTDALVERRIVAGVSAKNRYRARAALQKEHS